MAEMIKITNNRPRVHGIPGKHLLPGENIVPLSLWREACEIRHVRDLLSAEDLTEGDTFEGDASNTSLSTMPPQEALRTVAGTLDLDALKGWLETEQRAGVLAAIEVQIDKINAQGKPGKLGKKDAAK